MRLNAYEAKFRLFSILKSVVTALLTHDETTLSLGLPCIDHVFPGFKTGDFAVLFGHPFCKKLSFLLSVRCQLPKEMGGLDSTVIYIDGGNTFNPYSISAVARQHNLDPQSTLERIFVSRAFTAYQLSALISETLENALKQYRSRLVLISDVTALFLDRDVPTREAMNLFNNAMTYLSELVARREVVVVASCLSREGFRRRRFFFETVLFGRSGIVIRVAETKGELQLALESHPFLKPFTIDVLPNAVTLERFEET